MGSAKKRWVVPPYMDWIQEWRLEIGEVRLDKLGIKESLDRLLKAFFMSKETSIWVGVESRSADTAWWAISEP